MIRYVFFDLDGTLLPMDQDAFTRAYFGLLAHKMAPLGYKAAALEKAIWRGTAAMVANDGSVTNEEAFWRCFCEIFGEQARAHIPVFEDFYRGEFQCARELCGFQPLAVKVMERLHRRGYQTVLATNPIFPEIATRSRIRWAGLRPEDFLLYTTYENSRYSKPNPAYYREICQRLKIAPEECLMVGNDVGEDMVAQTLGMQVYLITDCLINRNHGDISRYPHGSFEEFADFVANSLPQLQ